MRIIDAFGASQIFTHREIFRIINSKLTISFAIFVGIALFGADPHGFRDIMPLYSAFAIWIVGSLSFLVFKVAMLSVWAVLSFWKIRLPYYMPISTAIEYGGVAVLMDWLARAATPSGKDPEILSNYPYYLLTIWLIELGFVRFGIPALIKTTAERADGRPAPLPENSQAASTPRKTVIKIGSKTIIAETLLYIRSEEHYLNVTTTTDSFAERAALTTIIPNLEEVGGVQPHRSWWIAPLSKPRYRRINGKPHVVLVDGTKVPVARGRMSKLKKWIESQNLD